MGNNLKQDQKIPEGWKKFVIDQSIELLPGYPFDSNLFDISEGYPLIRIRDLLSQKTETYYKGPIIPPEYIVKKGDILIGMDGDFNIIKWKGGIGLLNQRILKLLPKQNSEILIRLVYYLLPNILNSINNRTAQTTVKHLSINDVRNIQVISPQFRPEQSKIAEILSTVDEAIDKTEALIQKYQRIKQGLMQDLLTKGIDEKGNIRNEKTHKFKDSPLGRIPEEWEVVKIGDISKVRRGASPRPIDDPRYFAEEGRGWIRISDVTSIYKYLNKTFQYLSPLGESLSVPVNPDDLIMSICATIGKPALLKMKACIHDGFVLFTKLSEDIDKEFLFYLFDLNTEKLKNMNQTGTQGNLNTGIVSSFYFGKPNKPEQSRIASILSQSDEAIQKEETYKQKLLSLKRGLMEDLLTGELRVNHLLN